MPTSITAAPGLTASAPISRGTPTAATRTSARAQVAVEVAGARVADGHGRVRAPAAGCATGTADQLRAPDDDRLGPLQLDALVVEQLHHPGRGAGDQARRAAGRAGRRWSGSGRRRPCRGRSPRRPRRGRSGRGPAAGPGSRRRRRRRRARATSSSSSASWSSAGEAVVQRAHPRLLAGLVLVARRRSPRPGRRRRSPSPGPGVRPASRGEGGDLAADPLADLRPRPPCRR